MCTYEFDDINNSNTLQSTKKKNTIQTKLL